MLVSQHCDLRSAQRSISKRQISIVVSYGLSLRHKDHIVYYMLNKDIQKALKQGTVDKQEADKLKNIYVVFDEHKNEILTTYRPNKRKQKRILKDLA